MASRQSEVPALEPSGPLGKMSLPIGMCRRAFSYDDALEDPAPMTPPPADMGSIPWKPVMPERKYQHLAQVEEGEASVSSPAVTLSSATDSTDKVPVVKAKATHVIMNSLITKQTQESIQRFEQQAGLREAGYTPHKGLTTEETKYLRVAEALHKLTLQSGERTREEKQPASAQSSPGGTPHSSPKQKPIDLIRTQATRTAEDPAAFKPPKLDVPVVEGKKPAPRTHNLKPRDLNVLTPTGF
uniref:Putative monooxygenase p33MONOX n=1 Tax=Rousettus aegyptiacus TaxID=9407 RepID=A0A7J8FHQ6_ROUAE|nr:hypothetical protein HJG63_007214 [Rousettus aegyptiacus]